MNHTMIRCLVFAGFCFATLVAGSISPAAASPWTEGIKKVLVIRVDFSDRPTDPITATEAIKRMVAASHFFEDNSGGRTSLTTVVTPVLRMPDSGPPLASARAAALAAGFDSKNFDLDIVIFKDSPLSRKLTGVSAHTGVGVVKHKGVKINTGFYVSIVCHELGHNFGAPHARRWQTTDGTVIGDGKKVIYGSPFDVMGAGMTPVCHYNAHAKMLLGWLPEDAVKTVTESGTFILHPHDWRDASGLRALEIPIDDKRRYWVERRTSIRTNDWLRSGIEVYWTYPHNSNADLLDMTPDSPGGSQDSPLIIGRTFSDTAAGIHITPSRFPDVNIENIEVTVNIGKFPENHPPTLSLDLAPGQQVKYGMPLSFVATANDPDDDKLAYCWEWGDGQWAGGTGLSTLKHAFNHFRTYHVKCTVTDMKGGTTTATMDVALSLHPGQDVAPPEPPAAPVGSKAAENEGPEGPMDSKGTDEEEEPGADEE